MNPQLIPPLDAAGLPGPPWLFHVLLVSTFFLHMLFMNLTLGGTLLAAVAHFRGGGRSDDPRGALAGRLMAVNAYGISLTITTGIAPLLFIQVLYQPYFYTATILIAGVWLAFLLLLTLGYYSAYLYKFRGAPARGQGGGPWLIVSAVMFLLIAMVHVAVHLLHSQPERWADFASGAACVLLDPTYLPRLLHFVLAGIGFAALVATWWAVRKARAGVEPELNRSIAGFTWKWVLWTTVLQVADGFVLLLLLPRPLLIGFMQGGAATMIPLTLSILLGIGLLVMIAKVSDPVASPGTVAGTLSAMVLTIAIMSVTRHQLRVLSLAPATGLSEPVVAPQWFNFALWVVLLVAGLATVGYMVRRVLSSPATGADAA
jgi:hypothetical protein